MFGLGSSMGFPEQPPGTVETQNARLSFQPHLSHRQPGVLRDVIVQPVAVEQSGPAVFEAEKNVTGILAGDRRIESPQVGIERCRLTHEHAEGIDQMNGGLVNEKPGHGLEIRLAVEIRARPLAVARS